MNYYTVTLTTHVRAHNVGEALTVALHNIKTGNYSPAVREE